MEKVRNNSQSEVSRKDLKEFFNSHTQMELKKKSSQNKVMASQLFRVTGGKKIVVSNLGK